MEDAFPFLESATNLVEALRAQHPPEAIAAWFAGRAIIGDVDLSGLEYPHRLALRGCMFWGRVTMEDAHFGNTLDLSDCQFDKGLNLNTARIEGNLVLERCKFGVLGPNRFKPDEIDALSMWQVQVRGAVLLFASHVKARLNMRESCVVGRLTLKGIQIFGDLDLSNAQIGADLFCNSLSKDQARPTISGQVRMRGTRVGGQASFSGSQITGDLDLQSAEIGEVLFCCRRSVEEPLSEIGGQLWMAGTKVRGQVEFNGVQIAGDFKILNADIGAALLCRSLLKNQPRPEIGGKVVIQGTKVGGEVSFCGVKITGNLKLQSTEIGGSFFCRSKSTKEPRPDIGGQVQLLSTKVSGQVAFSGAKIAGDLVLVNAQLGADFHARSSRKVNPRTEIGGTVSFTGTRVEGVTTFVGAEIKGGFSAVRAEFDDGLFLASATVTEFRKAWRGERETAIAQGIDLSHAHINARLSLSGVNCGGAVILHDTRVDGDVLAASTPTHATRVTHVDASSLKVNGDFVFRTVQFACADVTLPCLNLSFAEINGNCYLPGGDGSNVRNLRLFHAKLGEAQFALDANTTVAADGFSFRQLNVPGSDYCKFLEATAPFQRSTYQTVERYLRERGDDRNADLVYREMMRRDRRQECPQRLLRLDHSLFGGNRQVSTRDRARGTTAPAPALPVAPPSVPVPAAPQTSKSWSEWFRSGLSRCASTARRVALWDVSDVWMVLLVVLVYRAFGDFDAFRPLQCSLALLTVLVLLAWRAQALAWLWEVFLDLTTGRGTSSARMGRVLVVAFLLMWAMFLDPESVKREYHPTAAETKNNPELLDLDRHPSEADKKWQPTEAAFAALRTVIPLMGDLPHTEWQPSSKNVKVFGEETWFKYESAAGLVHALSYIALPLFLASLSGLLKKRGD